MNDRAQENHLNPQPVIKGSKKSLSPAPPSAVPKYDFASDLKKQEAQLADLPLLGRFAESRRCLAADPHRPLYHFVSPESTMNDPNGLCFWQGRWHLFYQGYPPEDRRQHWGHAVSDDLIHWRDLPYAIYPGPEDCCYSGATLVEEDRVIAMYHGTQAGNMIAVSSDPLLLNWHKLKDQPVIPMSGSGNNEYDRGHGPDDTPLPYRVFDPCIWQDNGIYYSISGGRLPNGPASKPIRANFLFRSKNLLDWEYLHPFVEDDRWTLIGDDGACPYFWPIGDRHILFFYSHMSGGQALLGDYDRERQKFVATEHYRFNFGASAPGGVHAPSATPDGRGGVILIFNMNPARPSKGWNQLMSLPRHLTLSGGDELKIEPVQSVCSLRRDHQHIGTMPLPANREIVLEKIKGKALEIITEIETGESSMIELNVLRSPGREEFTRITFFPERGYRNRDHRTPGPPYGMACIDSSCSSLDAEVKSRPPETAPVLLQQGEPLRLRVFIDQSIVEVFVNEKQCLAVRVYPGREDSNGVSLRSQGSEAKVKRLDAWTMNSIS